MRKEVVCDYCRKKFISYKNRKYNYCSMNCYLKADKSLIYNEEFKKRCSKLMKKRWKNHKYKENQINKRIGKEPWNKETRGLCKPNDGSFKNQFHHPYWKNNGSWAYWHQQARKKLESLGFNIFRKIVHHKDGNFRNNNLLNLQIMDRQEHASLHYKKYWEKFKNGR